MHTSSFCTSSRQRSLLLLLLPLFLLLFHPTHSTPAASTATATASSPTSPGCPPTTFHAQAISPRQLASVEFFHTNPSVSSASVCAVQCAQHSLCRSAVFNHDTRTCALSHQNWLSHCQSSKERFKSFHLTTDGADALSLISCIDQCGSTRTDNGGFEHLLNILRARGAIDGGGPRFAPSNGALTGNVPPMPTRPIDPANATPLKKNRKASDRANELTDHFPMPDFLSLHEAPVLSKMQRQLLPAGSSEENSAAGNGFLSAVRQLHQMQKKLESLLREAAHRQDKVMAEEEGGKQDGTVVPLLVEKENNGDGEGQRRAIWWKAKDLRIRVDHDGKSSSPTSPSTPPASTRLPPSPMPSSTVQLPTSNYSVHYESSGELLDERVVVQTVHNGTERRVKSGGFIKLLKPGESIGIATAPEGPSAPPDTAIRLLNTAADRQIPIDLINIIGAGRSLPEQPKIRSSSSTSSAGTNFANSSTGQPPPAALRSLEEADQQQQQTVVINGKIVSPELLVKLLRTELADGKRTKASEAASTPRVHNKNEEEEGFLKLITLHGVAGQKAARLGQNGTFSPPALSLDMANSATDKPDDPGTIVCFRRIRRQQLTAPAAFATLKGITLNECRYEQAVRMCANLGTIWRGGAGNESTGGAEVGAVQKRCRSLQYDDTAEEGAKCDMNSADHNGKLELMTSSTGRKSDYFYVSCEIKYLLKTADKMCRDGLGLMGKTTPAALSSTSTWTSTTPPSITDNTKASTAAVPATAPSSSSSSSSDVASSVSSSTPSSSLTSVSTSSSSSTDSSSSIPSSSSTDSSSSIPSSSSSTDSSSSIPSSASLPLSSTVQSLSSSALSSSSSSTSTSSSSTSTSSSSTSTSSSSSSTSSSSSSTSTSSSSSSTSTSTSSSSSSTSTSTSSSSSSTSSSSSSSVVPLFAHSTGGVTEVGACFEHIAGFAMRGTAAGLERAVSLEQCECLCANSLTSRLYSFQCASATYYQADRDCVLNLDSRHSSPNLFGKAAGGDSELLEEANNANANANANVLVTYLGMLCSAAERAISQLANNPRGHEECLALIGNRAPPNTPTAPTTTTTTPTTTAPEGNNGTTKIAEVDGGTSTSSTAINSDRCFREQPNYVLEGMALAVETNVTVDQCKCFCAEAEVRYGSACQSVQFYYGSMTCLLNRENRLSDPEHFNFDAQGNGRHSYFDYRCGAESDTAVNYVNTKCGNGTAAVPLLLLANNATIAIGTTVLSNLSSPSTTAPPFRILKKKWRGGRRKKKKNGGQKIGKEVGGMATTTDGTTLKTVGTTIELPTTTTVPTVVPSSTKLNAIIAPADGAARPGDVGNNSARPPVGVAAGGEIRVLPAEAEEELESGVDTRGWQTVPVLRGDDAPPVLEQQRLPLPLAPTLPTSAPFAFLPFTLPTFPPFPLIPPAPTVAAPIVAAPTAAAPTSTAPTSTAPTATAPTAAAPTSTAPTAAALTAATPTVVAPTVAAPTAAAPTSTVPTATAPTSSAPTAAAPTSAAPLQPITTTSEPTTTSTAQTNTTTIPTTSTTNSTTTTTTTTTLSSKLVLQQQSLSNSTSNTTSPSASGNSTVTTTAATKTTTFEYPPVGPCRFSALYQTVFNGGRLLKRLLVDSPAQCLAACHYERCRSANLIQMEDKQKVCELFRDSIVEWRRNDVLSFDRLAVHFDSIQCQR